MSWDQQDHEDLGLIFLAEHDQAPPRQVLQRREIGWCQAGRKQSMIPGILQKTQVGLQQVHTRHPESWVYRTNLPYHWVAVRLAIKKPPNRAQTGNNSCGDMSVVHDIALDY